LLAQVGSIEFEALLPLTGMAPVTLRDLIAADEATGRVATT
jgi:hypothetical protein